MRQEIFPELQEKLTHFKKIINFGRHPLLVVNFLTTFGCLKSHFYNFKYLY